MDMKELRERVDLSPEAVAVALSVAVSTVRNWEAGTTEPRPGVTSLPMYLEVYGCTLSELVEAAKESLQKRSAK
ncbi:MAG: helix-turn-helix domain-containing protein [Leptolyngbya sp. SIOISBB]|nr:helix-turn-helix domain-containing protein [Leptolyngbya sp. SIOISBB]